MKGCMQRFCSGERKGDGTLVQGREIIWKLSIQRREERRNLSSEEERAMEPQFWGGKNNGTLAQGMEEQWKLSSGQGRAMEPQFREGKSDGTLVQGREERWNLSSGKGRAMEPKLEGKSDGTLNPRREERCNHVTLVQRGKERWMLSPQKEERRNLTSEEGERWNIRSGQRNYTETLREPESQFRRGKNMESQFRDEKSDRTLVQGREERWNISSKEGRTMEPQYRGGRKMDAQSIRGGEKES